MLERLDIENFGLFRKAECRFSPGFNVITGESGAGKSLVLESLAALLGARAVTDRIGPFGDRFRVRGEFYVEPTAPWWESLAGFGIEPDELLVLERQTGQDGRSVFRCQGIAVPAQTIRGLGEVLVQYQGQHVWTRMLEPEYFLAWVDRVADLAPWVDTVRERYQAWRAAEQRLADLMGHARSPDAIEAKRELLRELEAYHVVPGEDEAIQGRLTRYRSLRRLLDGYQQLLGLLDGTEDLPGILPGMSQVTRLLEQLAALDAELDAWRGIASESFGLLDDLRQGLSGWARALELDPGALEALEERADILSRLKRRFGPTLDEVIAYQTALAQEVQELDELSWRQTRYRQEADRLHEQLAAASEELSRRRQAGLADLEAQLTRLIRQMEMPTGELRLVREPVSLSERGEDVIIPWFSASRGQPAKPLAKVASGGELARVALALAVVGGQAGQIYVFDEVDTGLGGESAAQVGALLRQLGERSQVIAVSHQPVVAAQATVQFRVEKGLQEGRTQSVIERLSDGARAQEIARMLSGQTEGVAIDHAQSLLARYHP